MPKIFKGFGNVKYFWLAWRGGDEEDSREGTNVHFADNRQRRASREASLLDFRAEIVVLRVIPSSVVALER